MPFDPRRRAPDAPTTIAGGRTLHTWNDLLGDVPGLIGVKTGHTSERRLVAGRGRARARRDDLRDDPRQPDARAAQRRSRGAARLGLRRYRVVDASITQRRTYAQAQAAATAGRRSSLVAAKPLRPRRSPRAAARRAGRRAGRGRRCPCDAGQTLGAVRVYVGRAPARRAAARRRRAGRSSRASGRVGWYATADCRTTPAIARVLSACSHDRHRHAQRRDRPDADRAELPASASATARARARARRRQGDQRRPRAEGARRAGRRDRARRRPDRHAHRRGADQRGDPQRLRPDREASRAPRRRSSTRPAARTPRSTSGGRQVEPRRARDAAREARTTSRRAPSSSSSPARCRAASSDDFYAEAIRELLAHAASRAVLDSRGRAAAARRRGGAVPRLAEPARGRGARRPRVPRRRGLRARARRRSPSSAPATCSITTEAGCFALLREERTTSPLRGVASRSSSRSRRSARATPCSPAFLAARARRPLARGRAARAPSPRAPRRRSRSAPAASTRAR